MCQSISVTEQMKRQGIFQMSHKNKYMYYRARFNGLQSIMSDIIIVICMYIKINIQVKPIFLGIISGYFNIYKKYRIRFAPDLNSSENVVKYPKQLNRIYSLKECKEFLENMNMVSDTKTDLNIFSLKNIWIWRQNSVHTYSCKDINIHPSRSD